MAGLLLAAGNIVYLIISIWLIVMWKTHVVHPRFLMAGALIIFVIATLLAFAFLVGVVTSSTGVSIMTTYALFFFSLPLVAHDRIAAAVSTEWLGVADPARFTGFCRRRPEIGAAVVAFVAGGARAERSWRSKLSWAPFISTALFGLGCFALAALAFKRKEF